MNDEGRRGQLAKARPKRLIHQPISSTYGSSKIMGLEGLDLCFRLEKQFGIEITPAEGAAVLYDTPGAIHRYLMAKLHGEYRATPAVEPLWVEVGKAVNRTRDGGG